MKGMNRNYIIKTKKRTQNFQNDSRSYFLLVNNSWEEQLRSYASKISISTRFCCVISGQDPLPVQQCSLANFPLVYMLNLKAKSKNSRQWNSTAENKKLHQLSYAGIFTSGFKELCSILTVWNFAENRKERLGTYLLVPTHCSVKITVSRMYALFFSSTVNPWESYGSQVY